MAKIPTYESRRVPIGNIKRPNMPDYSVDLAQKAVKYANKVLDIKAEEEGLQQGFEEVNQGTTTIQEAEKASSFTIRGNAYKKGARNAYIAKTKTDLESQLTELYADTELNANSELFNEKINEIRDNISANTPSSLAPALLPEIEEVLGNYSNLVRQNEIEITDQKNTVTILDRFETVLMPRIQKNLRDGEIVEKDFAEGLAILEDLLDRNKISASDFAKNKNVLFNSLITPIFENEFRSATDQSQFLEDLQNGDKFDEIMQKVYAQYGDEYDEVLGKGSFPINLDITSHETIVAGLESQFKSEAKLFKAEQKQYSSSVTERIKQAVENGDDLATVFPFNDMMEGADKIMGDEEYKESLAYTWKLGAQTSYYTRGIKQESVEGIEQKIKDLDALITETEQLTDVDSQVKLEALNAAKTAYETQQSAILSEYNKGNGYAVTSLAFKKSNSSLFYNEDGTTRNVTEMTNEELIARRNITAE